MTDRWAEWLLLRRFAESEDVRREFMEHLAQVREKVLDNAEIASGDVLLDVGCGDGLIAFAGLERGVRTVICCDISEELLNECRTICRRSRRARSMPVRSDGGGGSRPD